MPLEIKNKRTGEVQACGVSGNTLHCGHCNERVVENTTWIALDDPYYCIIHQSCLPMFKFNGMSRLAASKGREEAVRALDTMQEVLHEMVSRPWWQKRGVPAKYQSALQEMLMLHHSLRKAGVLDPYDKTPVGNNEELPDK